MVNWDKRLVDLSNTIAQWSKDKSTKVGAIIADNENRIISVGYNGFPSGCNDDIDSRHTRPTKYLLTEHAERNAIYSAAKHGISLRGCSIYLNWFPCADCARAIIQSGIAKVVGTRPNLNDPKWGTSFSVSLLMFEETNINIVFID